ncbi:hypothetical protein SEA_KARDASHIAN_47 [Streptomyces phage Kardashian]|nr:hypothetical protein SEA_KARDASHIAN_47 [Streptomyces phage Kardashian]
MGAARKEITFTTPDGVQKTEEWWFELDETDAIEMDVIHDLIQQGNPEEYLKGIVDRKDSRALLNLWRDMLIASVCQREGDLLVKSPEITKQFRFGGAYRQFFSELITSDDAGASFFVQIMPQRLHQQEAGQTREPTNEELLAMSDEDFYKAAGSTDVRDMDKRFMTLAMQRKTAKAA